MDALSFMVVSFVILCIIGSVIAVTVEKSAERKEELKQLKRENQRLKNEIYHLNLMNELKGVKK